jgi:hypothetical protein
MDKNKNNFLISQKHQLRFLIGSYFLGLIAVSDFD